MKFADNGTSVACQYAVTDATYCWGAAASAHAKKQHRLSCARMQHNVITWNRPARMTGSKRGLISVQGPGLVLKNDAFF